MNRIPVAEPGAKGRRGFALWALGFRPFYLGGALFGSAAMLVWLAALDGHPLPGIESPLPGVLWHVHEMIFGFAAAIVACFLLTAVRAWTMVTPAQGRSLAALNLTFHLATAGGHMDWALRSAYVAVGLLVLFVTIIGGRIIPSFTANAIPGFEVRRWARVEATVMPLTALAFVLDGVDAPRVAVVASAIAAAFVQGLRLWGWRSWRVGNRPILAILHIAYAWIPVGCAMLALAAAGVVAHSLAIHAFTVGAIGCAIIAMITRTARGHTGRPLVAGRIEVACYALLVLAALIRVFGPWLAPQWTSAWIDASGASWIAAFAAYCVRYAGWLMAPRVDGKEG